MINCTEKPVKGGTVKNTFERRNKMHLKNFLPILAFLIAGFSGFAVTTTAANADSCWNHNGSTMRLVAEGNRRWFYYENPKPSLRNAGVRAGTLLFNGRKDGNYYLGTARRFSKFCPGNPYEYHVEGPVRRDQLKVTVEGEREVHNRCRGTGRRSWDTLVFTYIGKC